MDFQIKKFSFNFRRSRNSEMVQPAKRNYSIWFIRFFIPIAFCIGIVLNGNCQIRTERNRYLLKNVCSCAEMVTMLAHMRYVHIQMRTYVHMHIHASISSVYRFLDDKRNILSVGLRKRMKCIHSLSSNAAVHVCLSVCASLSVFVCVCLCAHRQNKTHRILCVVEWANNPAVSTLNTLSNCTQLVCVCVYGSVKLWW